MEDLSELSLERGNLESCVRCGLCLETCPTYVLTQSEEQGPRGRIAAALALLDGMVEADATLAADQEDCLVCEACTSVCPAGVRMEPIQVAVRASLRDAGHGSVPNRTLTRALRVLGDRERLTAWVRWLRRTQRTGALRLADRVGVLSALGVTAGTVPPVPDRFVDPDGGGWAPDDAGDAPVPTVELFTGCLMSTLLADVTRATGELLAAAGDVVRRTPGQTCCGALSAHGGDRDAAVVMAERNVAAFADSDTPIVVNSAGCGAFLRQYDELLGHDAAGIAQRTVDLTTHLATLGLRLGAVATPVTIAFHDPCHLRLAQGIVDAPRQLLDRLPGTSRVELADPTLCCGSAGAYSVLHPDTAGELGARRAATVVAAGAELVVTANPGCHLQLRGALDRSGHPDLPVRHIAEVLRDASGGSVREHDALPAPPSCSP